MRQIVMTFKAPLEFKQFIQKKAKKAKITPSQLIKEGVKKVIGYKGEI